MNVKVITDIDTLSAQLLTAYRQLGHNEDSIISSSSSSQVAAATLAGDADQPVSSDLILSSLAVLKLEKQTRLQKVGSWTC